MTPLRTLLDVKVHGIDTYVQTRREAGKSWRLITNDIRDDTGIDLAHETLRSWYEDTGDKASA